MASVSSRRITGVVYDKCLEAHYSLWNKDYTEHPLRTRCCIQRCEELGLLERCKRFPVREATLKEIRSCHSEQHYELLESTEHMDEEKLRDLSQQYDYIYFHQNSFENARLALGGAIDLVEDIVTDKISNGMAIVRPPGHHAMMEEFSGYCYFNNVAVAAQLMLDNHGLERIVILDWDVHHGQGSQFLFYNDPRVLYISIHRYEFGEEWPFLRESDYDFIGEGKGKGFNINLPLNQTGCGNDEYLSLFFNIVLPICQEFNPQLFLVSAGYDCAIGCPEGEMAVTPPCFAHFVNLLTPLASGKLALLLEGGYNLKSLSESMALSLRALLGDTTPSISPVARPKTCVIESVLNAIKVLHPYWKCLCPPDIVDRDVLSDQTHPYPSVLHHPPREGVDFYTEHTRPKMFPLLQECTSRDVMNTMDEINRQIDSLIKNTSLACPQFKSTMLHTGHRRTSQLYSSLCEHLRAKDLWDRCFHIDTPQEVTPSPQSYISKSIDAVLDRKCESSLVLTNPYDDPQSNGLDGEMSGDGCVTAAIQYAKVNRGVKRILVLRIVDSESSPVISEVTPGVLNISLSLPGSSGKGTGARPSVACETCHNATHSQPGCVHIPLGKIPVTDADILAAFHFIILPVSYEFCPDLVVFSWDTAITVCEQLMAIMTQYLHGLAQGKVVVVVSNQSSSSSLSSSGNGNIQEGTDSDSRGTEVAVITQCASVLLGEKCPHLPAYQLSDGAAVVIKATLDRVKHQWKSLVYREKVPKQS